MYATNKVKSIEAIDAAADFNRFLEEVRSRKETIEIVNRGVPWAYLVPANEPWADSHQFAWDLESEELTPEDKQAFAEIIAEGRKALKPLTNPWA